jgi:hypothetical protein
LEGYSTALFKFVETNKFLFSKEYLDEQFKTQVENLAFLFYYYIMTNEKVTKAASEDEKRAAIQELFETQQRERNSKPYLANATSDDVDKALAAHASDVTNSLSTKDLFVPWRDYIEPRVIAEEAIKGVFKNGVSLLDRTGIVIAGYGEDEYFACALVYDCFGIVLGKILYHEVKRKRINHSDSSQIMPIAQSEMVQTFIHGISNDAIAEVDTLFSKSLDSFETATGLTQDNSSVKDTIRGQFIEAVLDALFDHHTVPLRRVVGSLPIDELAALAETLISIESLKERVTRPTESVSGPIDVAAISKGRRIHLDPPKALFRPQAEPALLQRVGERWLE